MADLPEIPDDQVYVPLSTARRDYWVIETTSVDWLWVINNMVKKIENIQPNDVLMSPGTDPKNPTPTYLLKKATFPAEMLAAAFGVTVERVQSIKTIVLRPFKQPDNLPAVTVPYYGVA